MSILDRIVEDTREVVHNRKAKISLTSLEDGRYFNREPLDFGEALRHDGLAIISEIKKASPSRGIIRTDFHPGDVAERYEGAGAAAISVLTESLHFEGALSHLEEVRGVSSLPLLRKDFIIDVYQLFEARAHGADAVLLIAAVLDRMHLHDLVQASHELALSPLVEVYEMRELDHIDFDEVTLLGVNNRDLRTFEVDVDHSLRVFAEVPAGVVRISESGISSGRELNLLLENGIDAVLIGEILMRAEDPGAELTRLRKEMETAEAE